MKPKYRGEGVCSCKHRQSDHRNLVVNGTELPGHHGPCGKCEGCVRFTWVSFIKQPKPLKKGGKK